MQKKFRPANDIDPRSFKLFPFYDLIMNRHNFALTQVSSNSFIRKIVSNLIFSVMIDVHSVEVSVMNNMKS